MPIKNISKTRVVIGRLSIGSGEFIPGVPLTTHDQESIDRFVKLGVLAECALEVAEESKPVTATEEKGSDAVSDKSPDDFPEETQTDSSADSSESEPVSHRRIRRSK